MRNPLRSRLLACLLALTGARMLPAQSDYAAPILAGLSNHGRHQTEPYVTAGDRAYLIGTQDGNFPDQGGHVPGEMGGLWLHPIKLIDGFRAAVTDLATGRKIDLAESAELVTYPYGNRFRYPASGGLAIERFEFSPDGRDGVIVQYTITNAGARPRRLRFQLSVKTDLMPVWLSDRLGIRDGRDTVAWRAGDRVFLARDLANPWFAVWGAAGAADARPVARPEPLQSRGLGVTAASRHTLAVAPHGAVTLTFALAGSAASEGAALDAYRDLARNHAALLARKRARYASVIERGRVRIPDARLQEVYNWVKVNDEWLVRDVPGIGRGLGGGLMEYPWWFGTDGAYSLQALIATGDFDLARSTLRLLRDRSLEANGNGRIVHEVTTNGVVSNRGNTQETAQFVLTVGKLVRWSGDRDFAREMYPAVERGLHWLLTDMDRNRNLFPEGYGIMEVLGLDAEPIDVAVYTQGALEAAGYLARVLGDSEPGDP